MKLQLQKVWVLFVLFILLTKGYSQGFSGPYDPSHWTVSGTGNYNVFWINEPVNPLLISDGGVEISVVLPGSCGPFSLSFDWDFGITGGQPGDYEPFYTINGTQVPLDTNISSMGPLSLNAGDTFSFGFQLMVPYSGQICGATINQLTVMNSDLTPPVSLLPGHITIPANLACVGEINYLPDSNTFESLFQDPDCQSILSVTQLSGIPPWISFPIGTTMNVFEAVDGAGHVTTDSFAITVIDTGFIFAMVETLPVVYGLCHVTVTDVPAAIENCTGVTLTGTTTDSLYYDEPGIYYINWTYEGTQGNILTQMQTVAVVEGCIGIEDLAGINEPSIFPNPSSGNVVLSFSKPLTGPTSIKLVNLSGQVMYHGILQSPSQMLDFSSLQEGLYYLLITNADEVYSLPYIIKK
jgi:hypothetical protein